MGNINRQEITKIFYKSEKNQVRELKCIGTKNLLQHYNIDAIKIKIKM